MEVRNAKCEVNARPYLDLRTSYFYLLPMPNFSMR